MYLAGLAVYVLAIQGPSRTQFRRRQVMEDWTRALDEVLDLEVWAAWMIIPLVYLATNWLDGLNYSVPIFLGALGIALYAGALWLLWRAYSELGEHWSPKLDLMEDQEVITTGVYRFVRHPIYAGLWLWACAQLLLIHNWVEGFAFLVLYVPLYLIRVPREEAMMVQQFGDEYRRYLESTPALIPRPWRAYGTMEVEDSTPSTIEGPAEGDAEHSERVDAGED